MSDDIEMMATNKAQGQTNLVGEIHDDHAVGFGGKFIFAVGPETGRNHPLSRVNGFCGQGYMEGTGVIGVGGKDSGVGVSGEGGGEGTGVSGEGGAGGKGVKATGGAAMPAGEPGSGVEAVGGVSDTTKGPIAEGGNNRNPNAPGVVATSGKSGQKITLAETGNVGVFGQGGDQVDELKNDTEQGLPLELDFTVGSPFAGAGVIGRGGVHMANIKANETVKRVREPGPPLQPFLPGSAGIVGISGGTKMPAPEMYLGAGVFGISDSGRGGIFHSTTEAQLNLVPVLKSLNEVTPGKSRIGDLLVTINPRDEARGNVPTAQLWFCDLIDTNGQPNWQRVAFVP